ncbi:MAG: glycosyltransferase family 9 protein, partial [Flavobacteriales bacterium]|nr:glycosyltransferase family 9 protein [Flavobacteriales bacterium]
MKVLIVTGGGIGDILMTTPMFRALKQHQPATHIAVLLAQSVNTQILEKNQHVDEVIDWKPFDGRPFKLAAYLRERKFTHAVHNHSCPRWRYYTIPLISGIPKRIGFDRRSTGKGLKTALQKMLLTEHLTYLAKSELRTKMNLNLLQLLGIRDDDVSYDLHLERSRRNDETQVGIHPGSDGKGSIKRWPAKSFMELAQRIVFEQGKKVVFYIGPAEKGLLETIKPEQGIQVKECPTIADLVKDMSQCGSFISNDSGVSHIAAALHLPTLVLFGPTQPDEYVLPTKNINLCVTDYDCAICFRKKECQHCSVTCLQTLSVEKVMVGYTELTN